MLDLINLYFTELQVILKNNQIIAGAFSLWGLSVVTFILRSVPSNILSFFKRQSTLQLALNSQDRIYFDFLQWISEKGMNRFVRTFNVNNNMWGHYSNMFTLGYGTHWIYWNKRIIWFVRAKEEANQTQYTKETILITILGRRHSLIKKLVDDVETYTKEIADPGYLRVFNFKDGWNPLSTVKKRKLDSVIINHEQKARILKYIDKFLKEKEWYEENGIPYHMGLLLTGPPGTGKTSLIKGLASYYNRNMYLLNLKHLNDETIIEAFAALPSDAIIIIEDIDACGSNVNRTSGVDDEIIESLGGIGLTISGLLNGLDGIVSPENRIMIATTNHLERLDKALIRPGRFDQTEELSYMNKQTLNEYMKRFYDDFELDDNRSIKQNIRPCEVQQLILEHGSEINKITDKLYLQEVSS